MARVKRVKDEDFEQARQKQLQSFKDTGTYVEVPYEGQARHLKQVGAYLEAAGARRQRQGWWRGGLKARTRKSSDCKSPVEEACTGWQTGNGFRAA